MSLRWTEEELEDYRRRIRETVERANGAFRDTADSMRKFAEGEGTSSDPPQAAAHLPHSAEQSEAEAPAHRLSGAETRHRGKADRGGAYKGKALEMVPTEDEEQMALFTWAHHMAVTGKHPELFRLFHVPNGGSRGPAEAGRFKAMGVRPGVPDVFLDVPRGDFHGLRIEMKRRRGGELSEAQADWIDYYNQIGYRAVVCYGWDEARRAIEEYMSTEKGGTP